jgi:hypothetical protein
VDTCLAACNPWWIADLENQNGSLLGYSSVTKQAQQEEPVIFFATGGLLVGSSPCRGGGVMSGRDEIFSIYFLYMKAERKRRFSHYPRHQININRKIQIQWTQSVLLLPLASTQINTFSASPVSTLPETSRRFLPLPKFLSLDTTPA